MDLLLLSLIEFYQTWLNSCPTGQADLAKVIAMMKTMPSAQPVRSNIWVGEIEAPIKTTP